MSNLGFGDALLFETLLISQNEACVKFLLCHEVIFTLRVRVWPEAHLYGQITLYILDMHSNSYLDGHILWAINMTDWVRNHPIVSESFK